MVSAKAGGRVKVRGVPAGRADEVRAQTEAEPVGHTAKSALSLARFLRRLADRFADPETVPFSPVCCPRQSGAKWPGWQIPPLPARPHPPLQQERPREMNAEELVAVAKRGAVTLASDPGMRHYSPDTLALVYEETVINLAGAGSLTKAAERMANDPELAAIPIGVIEDVMAAAVKHFARALSPEVPA